MSDFTDFILWLRGGRVLEFRHSAKSVHEFWGAREEIIFDIYGSTCVRRSEISTVRIDPRPYFRRFYEKYGRFPYGYPRELGEFIDLFSEEEREKIKEEYYALRDYYAKRYY